MPQAKKINDGPKVITGSRPKLGVFKTVKERTTAGGITKPFKYTTQSMDTAGYSKGKSSYQLKTAKGEGDKTGSKVTSSKTTTVPRKKVMSTLNSLKNSNKSKNK